MTVSLKLINSISEITPTYLHDSIQPATSVKSKQLRITKPINIIQLKMRWVSHRPDMTSLTIIDNQYLYCPQLCRGWLAVWDPLLGFSEGTNEITLSAAAWQAVLRAKQWLHDLIILPDYYGDYSFHFGHFLIDVLPILECLWEKRSERHNKDAGFRYSLYPHLGFHKELLSVSNLAHQVVIPTNKDIIRNLVYVDKRRVVWAERTRSRIALPSHNYGFAKAIISKIDDQSSKDLSDSDSATKPIIPRYRGLLFNRIGSSLFQRLSNLDELRGHRSSMDIRGDQIEFEFESLNYIEAGVAGRVQKARDYDFVIGAFGSHFVPTMLDCKIIHMFIVPFRPPQQLIEERLECFLYYPKNLYHWILANPPSHYSGSLDMEAFHYSDYKMDPEYVLKQLAFRLHQAFF
jgi:hypothetical protein